MSYADGVFSAAGGASVSLWDVARAGVDLGTLPADLRGPLEGISEIVNRVGGYPYGAHVCEVEVDPDTGHVAIVAWSGVDDVGRAVLWFASTLAARQVTGQLISVSGGYTMP